MRYHSLPAIRFHSLFTASKPVPYVFQSSHCILCNIQSPSYGAIQCLVQSLQYGAILCRKSAPLQRTWSDRHLRHVLNIYIYTAPRHGDNTVIILADDVQNNARNDITHITSEFILVNTSPWLSTISQRRSDVYLVELEPSMHSYLYPY